MDDIKRRSFLGLLVGGISAVVGALMAVPLGRFAAWPMFRRDLRNNARATQCAINAAQQFPDGTFGFTLTVETGLTYRVQSSADLSTWMELTNFISTDLSMPFIDTDAPNAPSRFYRLATP